MRVRYRDTEIQSGFHRIFRCCVSRNRNAELTQPNLKQSNRKWNQYLRSVAACQPALAPKWQRDGIFNWSDERTKLRPPPTSLSTESGLICWTPWTRLLAHNVPLLNVMEPGSTMCCYCTLWSQEAQCAATVRCRARKHNVPLLNVMEPGSTMCRYCTLWSQEARCAATVRYEARKLVAELNTKL